MPSIEANGIRFNYVVNGSVGAPWITLSNSLATNVTMWDEQVELLAGAWRVLRYDQRGHGATEVSAPPYHFTQLAADVVALWDELEIETSVYCGLSMGGTTGLGLALDHPARLRALVGCDCRCDSPPGFREAWDDRIAHARTHGMAGMAEPTVDRWFTDAFRGTRPEVIERVKAMIRSTPLDGFIGCSNALQEIPFRDRLSRIEMPTLLLCGEHDPAANPDYCRGMHESMPGSRFEVIEHAGHISNLENAPRFNAVLGEFLSTL